MTEEFEPVDLPELLVITGRACARILSGYQKGKSEEGRILLQSLIDESYKQFTEAVAEGRNLSVEEVKKFAIITLDFGLE